MATTPAPPTTINTTAADIDAFLKGLESAIQPIIQAELEALEPALALPVIEQISGAIEDAIENYITKQVELGATFLTVDFQTDAEDSAMDQAAQDLETAEASGDAAAIAEAKEEYDNAQTAVARDNGSAQPQ